MKPFKHIESTKRIINELKYELEYSKNKVKDAKRINTLIDCVNSFQTVLESKLYTDSIENLLYCLIYEWLLSYKVNLGNEIPINLIVHNIIEDIKYPSSYKRNQIISLLKDHTLCNIINNNKLDSFDFVYPDYDLLLNDLINNLKSEIKWNLIK